MNGTRLGKLELIDLIRAFRTVGYTWDLEQDRIDWRGPINLLLSPEAPFKSGSSFHNCLSTYNLYKRMHALANLKPITNEYQSIYALTLPNYEYCSVKDEGEVFFNKEGHPYKLQGTLTFLDEEIGTFPQDHNGYDVLTGFPEKELVLETLSCFTDQAILNRQGGAYIALTVDKLAKIACQSGVNVVQKVIHKVGEALRATIRFDDFIGRTSGCGFGIILKDCDHWGLIRAYQRIAHALNDLHLYAHDHSVEAPISMGGIVFPREDFTPAKIMQRAERYLFEAQENGDMKALFDPSYLTLNVKRSSDIQAGSLRHTDARALQA